MSALNAALVPQVEVASASEVDEANAEVQGQTIEVHATENTEKIQCTDCEFDTKFEETMESHRQAIHIVTEIQSYTIYMRGV